METPTLEGQMGPIRATMSLEGCRALVEKEEKWIRECLVDFIWETVDELEAIGVIDRPPIPAVE